MCSGLLVPSVAMNGSCVEVVVVEGTASSRRTEGFVELKNVCMCVCVCALGRGE